jgi:hypothetical protein
MEISIKKIICRQTICSPEYLQLSLTKKLGLTKTFLVSRVIAPKIGDFIVENFGEIESLFEKGVDQGSRWSV